MEMVPDFESPPKWKYNQVRRRILGGIRSLTLRFDAPVDSRQNKRARFKTGIKKNNQEN